MQLFRCMFTLLVGTASALPGPVPQESATDRGEDNHDSPVSLDQRGVFGMSPEYAEGVITGGVGMMVFVLSLNALQACRRPSSKQSSASQQPHTLQEASSVKKPVNQGQHATSAQAQEQGSIPKDFPNLFVSSTAAVICQHWIIPLRISHIRRLSFSVIRVHQRLQVN